MSREYLLANVEDDIRDAMERLQEEAWDNTQEHGFHEAYRGQMEAVPVELKASMRRTNTLARLALIGSEVGEAVRAVQHGNDMELREELADIVIRVLDLCGEESIDLGKEVLRKMRLNRKRPWMHGKVC